MGEAADGHVDHAAAKRADGRRRASSLMGAKPASRATWPLVNRPMSGRYASNTIAETGPMPITVRISSIFFFNVSHSRKSWAISASIAAKAALSSAMCAFRHHEAQSHLEGVSPPIAEQRLSVQIRSHCSNAKARRHSQCRTSRWPTLERRNDLTK